MVKVERKINKSIAGAIQNIAKEFGEYDLKVGWFATARYADAKKTSVAMIAAIQEFGAKFTHPGGTRYVVSNKKSRFVRNDYVGPVHGVTQAHEIVIPPRPFMRPAIQKNKTAWAKFLAKGVKRILKGKSTAENVLELLGLNVEGEIQGAISDVHAPALAASTIASKKSKRADKKTTGSLTKPLIDSSYMRTSVAYTVGKNGDTG